MGTLYLVRHGQASFGADDYDQLSELGERQSVRLGEYFAERAIHFDGLIAGTLRRHKQTLDGILRGTNRAGEHLAWEGLNEYDSEAVIATVHPHKLERPTSPEMVRPISEHKTMVVRSYIEMPGTPGISVAFSWATSGCRRAPSRAKSKPWSDVIWPSSSGTRVACAGRTASHSARKPGYPARGGAKGLPSTFNSTPCSRVSADSACTSSLRSCRWSGRG